MDADPFLSDAADWRARRDEKEDEYPLVFKVPASALSQQLETARSKRADLVIIDTAGDLSDGAREAVKIADLVLVVSRGLYRDMRTLPNLQSLIVGAGNPPAFVLYNYIHPTAQRIADELKALTPVACKLPACPVHLSRYAIHEDGSLKGRAAQEIDNEGKAAAELERLYLFINEQRKGRTHGNKESRRTRTGA
jgi:chromosome partitioning protein